MGGRHRAVDPNRSFPTRIRLLRFHYGSGAIIVKRIIAYLRGNPKDGFTEMTLLLTIGIKG
jgi:hypothetical protein